MLVSLFMYKYKLRNYLAPSQILFHINHMDQIFVVHIIWNLFFSHESMCVLIMGMNKFRPSVLYIV